MREKGGKVIYPVKGERGEDSVKRVRFVWKIFFVLQSITSKGDDVVEGQGCVAVKEAVGGVGRGEFGEASREGNGVGLSA